MVASPLPLLLAFLNRGSEGTEVWRLWTAGTASMVCLVGSLTMTHRPAWGRWLWGGACLLCLLVVYPYASRNPFAALVSVLTFIATIGMLTHTSNEVVGSKGKLRELTLERARWAARTTPSIVAIVLLMRTPATRIEFAVMAISFGISLILFILWAFTRPTRTLMVLPFLGFVAIGVSLVFLSQSILAGAALATSGATLLCLPDKHRMIERTAHWWEILLNQPSRLLFTTFFLLCTLGTLVLMLPVSAQNGAVDWVDAVFTSVSAVCVTGLVVLDTPNDFTLFGQGTILTLIQLGGLGIMGMTTIAFHAMGRRLSLKQERLLISMTDSQDNDLIRSLALVLKFTLIVEFLGAVLLAGLFYSAGDPISTAIWRGLFTSISAFCNAGFALQSDSLVAFQSHPLVLQVVSGLIILGGLAPATSLAVPSLLRGKRIPIPARLALITTVMLLLVGTLCMLAFEWSGLLAEMNLLDKIHNAWFQSVTLRTAGFNSLALEQSAGPTLLVMIILMFIGGSPGGTAGGIKTTTLGVLAITFWNQIGNRSEVITQKRRIHPSTIYRAVTIVVAGGIVWILILLMLMVTQNIPARALVFEATSAIATVGLSLGATTELDQIGKIIIIVAMFAGRLGPITLFMLLTDSQSGTEKRYPVERISLF